ncbi:TPA: 50S ribosomal protein L28 [Candidatus Dependentiae bacterium]|nr:MAG: 50S ribosomal protein L28 [candidate division TM6 bacterium GW2011_GWE2_31_21]KKP54138.1 MAG: 50S ribosomal protein L28 [candidate division TM6 bacterium GW2011_GWF2_33_332]HBS47859.1 50S ribosomal protein L28 [Candidatus Dependentiae bacterium]HBZ73044.1 50S ribosomal protein L28 [Candidatus Dependentiae bacterium]
MANICVICDKRPQVGNLVSHAKNRTKRLLFPNVHVIRYRFRGQSNVFRGAVCTKCVKAGKVEKVV